MIKLRKAFEGFSPFLGRKGSREPLSAVKAQAVWRADVQPWLRMAPCADGFPRARPLAAGSWNSPALSGVHGSALGREPGGGVGCRQRVPRTRVLRADGATGGLGRPDANGPSAQPPCCSSPRAAGSVWTCGVGVCRLQGRQGCESFYQ